MKVNWNRAFLLANMVVFLLLLAAGCSKSNPATSTSPIIQPPSPSAAARPYGSSAIPNDHTFAFTQQQAKVWDWSLIPTVHAQTQTPAVMTGNYSGFCTATVEAPATPPGSTGIYGLGFNNAGDPNECASSASGQPQWEATPQDVLSLATSPAPVIGGGTLQGLVAIAKTAVLQDASDGVLSVWVEHGSTWTETPITCSLGAATATGNGSRCEDTTNTYSVSDGDGIAVVLTMTGNNQVDSLNGLQVFLGKQ